MKYKVITISREFGSGGHFIGEQIAKELGYKFYDHEIVERISMDNQMGEDTVERIGEELKIKKKSILSLFDAKYESEITDEIFIQQRAIINELAKKGNCVIVGRCADYILRENKQSLHVFVYADPSFKIQRIAEIGEIDEKEAENKMIIKELMRKNYYEHYTDQKWADVKNFDICLKSNRLGLDGCIKAIVDFVKE